MYTAQVLNKLTRIDEQHIWYVSFIFLGEKKCTYTKKKKAKTNESPKTYLTNIKKNKANLNYKTKRKQMATLSLDKGCS